MGYKKLNLFVSLLFYLGTDMNVVHYFSNLLSNHQFVPLLYANQASEHCLRAKLHHLYKDCYFKQNDFEIPVKPLKI